LSSSVKNYSLISPKYQISSSDGQDVGLDCILLDFGLHSLFISEKAKKIRSADQFRKDLEDINSLGGEIEVESTNEICQSLSSSSMESDIDIPLNRQTSNL
jgi:hypothetical protein